MASGVVPIRTDQDGRPFVSPGDIDTALSLSWGTDDVAERFARGLRVMRTEFDLSVRDLADEVGRLLGRPFHYTAISKIEAGTRAVSIDEAVVIAEVLLTNVYMLIRRGTLQLDQSPDELRASKDQLEQRVAAAKARADETAHEAESAADALEVVERALRGVTVRLAELEGDESDG